MSILLLWQRPSISDYPVTMYLRTGMNMAPETVARLAKDFDNIVGIKGVRIRPCGEEKRTCVAKTFPFTPARMDWQFRSCPWEEGVISVLANIVG